MGSFTLPLLSYAGSWAGIIAGVWFLFDKLESTATVDARAATAQWLREVGVTTTVSHWPHQFAVGFDRVFGQRHFSLRCFFRSCLASTCSALVVLILWTAINPRQVSGLVHSYCFTSQFIIAFPIVGICSFPFDYISLLKTRFAIGWLGRRSSAPRIITVLLIDALITYIVAVLAMQVVWRLMTSSEPLDLEVSLYILGLPGSDCDIVPFGIWFYATFFTSTFVWLYGASALIVRLAHSMDIWSNRLRRLLDVDRKPFQSIGAVAIMLVTVLFILCAPMVFSHKP
jgi:hypothetical protein